MQCIGLEPHRLHSETLTCPEKPEDIHERSLGNKLSAKLPKLVMLRATAASAAVENGQNARVKAQQYLVQASRLDASSVEYVTTACSGNVRDVAGLGAVESHV